MPSRILFLAFLLCATVPGAHAAGEFTPLSAYRISGDFEEASSGATLDVDDEVSYGFIFNLDSGKDAQYEFLYSEQSSKLRAGPVVPTSVLFDIDITYIHLGGNKLFPIDGTTASFLGAGLGVTRFDPDFAGYTTETKFSFNLSGGIKKMLTKSIGIRAGLSLFATPVNNNSSVFCVSDSGCSIRFKSDFFTQYDASVGLVVRF